MTTENDNSPIESDLKKWAVPLVSLTVSITTFILLLPPTLRLPAVLLCIEAVCIYIMTKRGRPSLAGTTRGSYIYQDGARFVARFISTGIPFFLAGIWLGPIIGNTSMADIDGPEADSNSTMQSVDIYGTYEWQWAGENWYGRVVLAEQNGAGVISDARAGFIEKVALPNESDKIHMNGMLLNLNNGNFVTDDEGLQISLSVEKTDRRTNSQQTETIVGNLRPVMCYAGVVYYGDERKKGDMILVKYLSNVGTDVDDWFNDPNPPWYEYIVDQ